MSAIKTTFVVFCKTSGYCVCVIDDKNEADKRAAICNEVFINDNYVVQQVPVEDKAI